MKRPGVTTYGCPLFQRLKTFASILLLWSLMPAAYADTFGLPPCTAFETEWKTNETTLEVPQFFTIRSQNEWQDFWKKAFAEEKNDPPAVNFKKMMVVGIVPKGHAGIRWEADPVTKESTQIPAVYYPAIYRIELDDAVKPTELLVRISLDSTSCQQPKPGTLTQGARLHLVVIGKSALPVRFILDEAEDGGMFGRNGGVTETTLGQVMGLELEKQAVLRADYREQAEKLVRDSFTETEIAAAKKALWPKPFGDRYPQLWSIIDVRRLDDKWNIRYDNFHFEVDVATGKTSRLESN